MIVATHWSNIHLLAQSQYRYTYRTGNNERSLYLGKPQRQEAGAALAHMTSRVEYIHVLTACVSGCRIQRLAAGTRVDKPSDRDRRWSRRNVEAQMQNVTSAPANPGQASRQAAQPSQPSPRRDEQSE